MARDTTLSEQEAIVDWINGFMKYIRAQV